MPNPPTILFSSTLANMSFPGTSSFLGGDELLFGLFRVGQEIQRLEGDLRECRELLGEWWEHLPPVDPELIRERMLALQQDISSLEDRERALHEEQQDLIISLATWVRN